MKATAADQQRLLEVQGLDLAVARLEHQRAELPQRGQLAEVVKLRQAATDRRAAIDAQVGDLQRQIKRVELDVENVQRRMDRDQRLMDSGTISSPRQLEELQHEIGSLRRRVGDLEDSQLELMERAEEMAGELARVSAEVERLEVDGRRLETELTDRTVEIEEELGRASDERQRLAATVTAELLALYEGIARQNEGVGAALLRGGRCEGCHMQLPPTERQRLSEAAPDEVVRCEECLRILIRPVD